MNFLSFSSPSFIGIDIHLQGIRLVQCKKIRHGFLLEKVAMSELPPHIFNEGKVADWNILSKTLHGLIDYHEISGRAHVSFPANLVRMQTIQVPADFSDEEIQMEIDQHIRRDFPGLSDHLCMDFFVSIYPDKGHKDVFFAATRKDYLSKYVETINEAGLTVNIVDIDIYALKRAICFALPFLSFQMNAKTILYIAKNYSLLLNLSANGISFFQKWERTGPMDASIQIKKWIQLCLSVIQNMKMNKIIFCTSEEYFKFISMHFENQSSIQLAGCYSPDPFSKMELSSHLKSREMTHFANDFLIACGLVMREYQCEY